MTSGRFVAPTTVTPVSSSTPSISFSRLVSTPSCDPPIASEDRDIASASISSYHELKISASCLKYTTATT